MHRTAQPGKGSYCVWERLILSHTCSLLCFLWPPETNILKTKGSCVFSPLPLCDLALAVSWLTLPPPPPFSSFPSAPRQNCSNPNCQTTTIKRKKNTTNTICQVKLLRKVYSNVSCIEIALEITPMVQFVFRGSFFFSLLPVLRVF